MKNKNNPCGLTKFDSLADCFKRADMLSNPNGTAYSGLLTSNKDLRRIVLLVREYRKLQDFNKK